MSISLLTIIHVKKRGNVKIVVLFTFSIFLLLTVRVKREQKREQKSSQNFFCLFSNPPSVHVFWFYIELVFRLDGGVI
jgi:hypothetical protein